jgi:hypothetical protein
MASRVVAPAGRPERFRPVLAAARERAVGSAPVGDSDPVRAPRLARVAPWARLWSGRSAGVGSSCAGPVAP